MFEESHNDYYPNEIWRGVPIPISPLSHFYDNDNDNTNQNAKQNTNQKSISPTPAVMQQPNKAKPQVHADKQNSEIPATVPIINNPLYNQGWLQKQIGKYIKVSFLLGTGTFQDRTGILQKVGISFIILKDVNTNDLTMCDIYSIKFVTVYDDQTNKCIV